MNSLLVNSNLKYSKLYVNGSKSESNRLLILKSLYKNLSIINISDCDDTNFLEKALKEMKPKDQMLLLNLLGGRLPLGHRLVGNSIEAMKKKSQTDLDRILRRISKIGILLE